jgi:hypothetical protein
MKCFAPQGCGALENCDAEMIDYFPLFHFNENHAHTISVQHLIFPFRLKPQVLTDCAQSHRSATRSIPEKAEAAGGLADAAAASGWAGGCLLSVNIGSGGGRGRAPVALGAVLGGGGAGGGIPLAALMAAKSGSGGGAGSGLGTGSAGGSGYSGNVRSSTAGT